MVKKNIGTAVDIYPMPVVIVGTVVNGRPNFMTVAWITKLSPNPSLLGISVGGGQYSAGGIRETGEFSINFPGVEEMELTDYCGLVHGNIEDKAAQVDIFQGSLENAPMVRQCPLNIECRLHQTVQLDNQWFFIGEVANVYASERILTEDQIDLEKFHPFVLTMPSNGYWALGERIGDPWSVGKNLMQPGRDV